MHAAHRSGTGHTDQRHDRKLDEQKENTQQVNKGRSRVHMATQVQAQLEPIQIPKTNRAQHQHVEAPLQHTQERQRCTKDNQRRTRERDRSTEVQASRIRKAVQDRPGKDKNRSRLTKTPNRKTEIKNDKGREPNQKTVYEAK